MVVIPLLASLWEKQRRIPPVRERDREEAMPGRKTCGNTRLSKLTFAFHPKTWGLSDDLARSQDLDRMIEAQRIEDQRFFEVQRMQEQLDAILRALQDIQKYQLEGTTTPSVAYWKLG